MFGSEPHTAFGEWQLNNPNVMIIVWESMNRFMEKGILYISSDDEYLSEAIRSAHSVSQVMPELPIAIITDTSSPGGVFDIVIERNDLESSVVDKCQQIHRTPFQKTLYLDTDTYVARPLEDIFDLLSNYDLITGLEKGRHYDIGLPPSVPHRQGGVIGFDDNQRVSQFFEFWRNIYAEQREKGRMSDQPPLTKAVIQSDVRVHTLPVEDNCLIYYGERLEGPVRIIHGHDDLAKHARKLNEKTTHRIFLSLFDNRIIFGDTESLNPIELFYHSLVLDGFQQTTKRIVKKLLHN